MSARSRRKESRSASVCLLVALLLGDHAEPSTGFLPLSQTVCPPRRCRGVAVPLFSSIGRGADPDDEDFGDWGKFLDPNFKESEEDFRAREYMSENSVPLSFDADEEMGVPSRNTTENASGKESLLVESASNSSSSALVGATEAGALAQGAVTEEMLANNPYMAVVSRLSPNELISRFTSTAHPRVQNAVRQTVLGLIGGLPKMAFQTTTVMSGQRLASLMFQLQLTGYMFKNADYRLSLSQMLVNNDNLLPGVDDQSEKPDTLRGKIRGKLRLRFGGLFKKAPEVDNKEASAASTASGDDDGIEVDADAYVAELRKEVEDLRQELVISRKEKEDSLRKDLLMYIKTLPEKELRELSSTMSEDVLVAMKGLVNAVITGIGDGQIGPGTVTEQSSEAMAQLCMWQLALGYNLRTLEVREEMKKSLAAAPSTDSGSAHGAFE